MQKLVAMFLILVVGVLIVISGLYLIFGDNSVFSTIVGILLCLIGSFYSSILIYEMHRQL